MVTPILEMIRNKRKFLKISQKEIAEHLGGYQSNYSLIEKGGLELKVKTLLTICEYLKIKPSELFTQYDSLFETGRTYSEVLGVNPLELTTKILIINSNFTEIMTYESKRINLSEHEAFILSFLYEHPVRKFSEVLNHASSIGIDSAKFYRIFRKLKQLLNKYYPNIIHKNGNHVILGKHLIHVEDF